MFRTLMEHIFPLSAGNLLVDTEIPESKRRKNQQKETLNLIEGKKLPNEIDNHTHKKRPN